MFSRNLKYMPINVFNLAGYKPNLFEYEPLQVFCSIDSNLYENEENDCINPIFHTEPESPKPWVEYYRQSPINANYLRLTT